MASYGIPTSFGFMERYAGMGAGGEERDIKLERSRLGLESDRIALDTQRLNYDTARMQNEETQYKVGKAKASRSALQSSLKELDDDPDGTQTAAGTALNYVNAVAEIDSLVKRDELEKAAEVYQTKLAAPASAFRKEYQRLAATKPEDEFEKSLQTSAQEMFSSKFDRKEVTMLDGTVSSIGALFGQGQYKELRANKLRRESFDDGFIAKYNSDDQFTRETFRSVADPVLSMFTDKRSMLDVTNMAGGQKDTLPLGSVSLYGTYLARNFDDMREELGDAGLSRLVQDAKDLRIRNGTYEDAAEFVRDFAANRRDRDAGADMALAVQDGLKAFDWIQKLAAGSDGSVSPDGARTMSKYARWAAEAGVTDFDNDDVRRRFEEMAQLTATLSRLDVPVFSLASNAGVEFRKSAGQAVAAAQYGTEPPGNNYFRRVGDFMTRAIPLLTGGTAPANEQVAKADPRVGRGELAAVARATTGRPVLDNALARMLGTLANAGVEAMSRDEGLDSSAALLRAVSDQRVRDQWARDLSATSSFSSGTSAFVINEYVKGLGGPDGLRASSLSDAIVRVAQLPSTSYATRRASDEARRWLASEEMGERLYRDRKDEVVASLLRRVPGMTRQQADAAVQSALTKDLEHLKAGHAEGSALDTLGYIGVGYSQVRDSHGYPVIRDAEGENRIVVPNGQWERFEGWLKGAFPDKKAREAELARYVKEADAVKLVGATPLLQAGSMDLRRYSAVPLQFGNVRLPGIPAGLVESDPTAFDNLHSVWRQMYEAQVKGLADRLRKDEKESGKDDI